MKEIHTDSDEKGEICRDATTLIVLPSDDDPVLRFFEIKKEKEK